MVAKILGVLGVVVAADSPRQLIFSQIPWNELDWVEWIGFTGLSGRHDSAADGFFGNLCSGKKKKSVSHIDSFRSRESVQLT